MARQLLLSTGIDGIANYIISHPEDPIVMDLKLWYHLFVQDYIQPHNLQLVFDNSVNYLQEYITLYTFIKRYNKWEKYQGGSSDIDSYILYLNGTNQKVDNVIYKYLRFITGYTVIEGIYYDDNFIIYNYKTKKYYDNNNIKDLLDIAVAIGLNKSTPFGVDISANKNNVTLSKIEQYLKDTHRVKII